MFIIGSGEARAASEEDATGIAAGEGAEMGLTVFTGGAVVVEASRDGRIITSEAVAFENGRVVALGERALALAGREGVEAVDLEGGALIPGLGDGHAHPLLGGLEAAGPRIRQQDDLEGVIAAVGAWLLADRHAGEYDPPPTPLQIEMQERQHEISEITQRLRETTRQLENALPPSTP